MQKSHILLHFGYDGLLSEARALVLEQAGYEVVIAYSGKEAFKVLRNRSVALILVCHSVPPDEAATVLEEMKRLRPLVPIVMVHVGGLSQTERRYADGFVDGLRGPDHLLARISNFVAADTSAAAS
jgi:DNA-binding response OmpR family regulator